MQPFTSVIICTHNPNRLYLDRVLAALQAQSLPYQQWELIVVDNASDSLLAYELDLSWHPGARVVREERLGLTWARIAGIQASQGDYLLFVDDDNVLDRDYLSNTAKIFQEHPKLGVIGGKSIPQFQAAPEPWFTHPELRLESSLGCRDLGDEVQTYIPTAALEPITAYPQCAPIGAGMALQRRAVESYVNAILEKRDRSVVLDRAGQALTSGGDCDINLTLLKAGWGVGYFPQLCLAHLIPAKRLSKEYLARINHGIYQSWIQVLDRHGIRPWKAIAPWTLLPRKIKAFFVYQPWKDPVSYILWQRACGQYEGQAQLTKIPAHGSSRSTPPAHATTT